MGKTVLETPQDLYDALNAEFSFGLDVCALPYNAKCPRFYSPEQDGLKQPWDANCWCNPPFDRSMGTWVRRCYEAAQAGHTAVVLIHGNYHDTQWWHDYAMKASEIRYLRGRPKFHDGDYTAALRTMVAVFRPKCQGPPICVSIDRTGRRLAPNPQLTDAKRSVQ